jgi:hypothetical protein
MSSRTKTILIYAAVVFWVSIPIVSSVIFFVLSDRPRPTPQPQPTDVALPAKPAVTPDVATDPGNHAKAK